MKYNLNGKNLVIPDAEINKLMKTLDLTKEEAIDTWLEDNDYKTNETVEELTEKAKSIRHYEKSDKERKKTTRERKVDEEKKKFLEGFRIFVEGCGGCLINKKNEAEFSFTYGENDYTVKLVKHRAKKAGVV